MADYQVLVTDLLTGKILGELPVISASWSHVRNAPGSLDATLAISQPDDVITSLGSVIPDDAAKAGMVITRDGTIVAGGPWWTWDADLGAGTLNLHGQGWHSYVRRRTLRTDLSYTDQDQTSVIAKALVDATQTTGQAPVISTSDVVASGQLRDRTYNAADRNNLGQLLEDLAAVEHGFAFRYDTVRDGDLIKGRFLTGPESGRRTPLVFATGKNITKLTVQGDGTAVVTHVDGVGAGTGSQAIRTTQANAGLIGVYPLLDDVVSHTDVTVASTLAAYARNRLARGKAPAVLPRVNVDPAADPILGSYVVGDVVRVRAGYGLVALDDLFLLTQIDGSLDQSGEKVSLTFASANAFVPI